MEVRLTIELEVDFASDILITAFDGDYGGSWYWADPSKAWVDWLATEKNIRDESLWMAVRIVEKEVPEKELIVDHETIRVGLQRICDEDFLTDRGRTSLGSDSCQDIREAISEKDSGQIDSDLADVIVQVGVFGGVVYG